MNDGQTAFAARQLLALAYCWTGFAADHQYPATKVANLLADISMQINALGQRITPEVNINLPEHALLQAAVTRLADSYEETLLPLLSAMNHKIRLDHSIWDSVREISTSVSGLDQRLMNLAQAKAAAGAKAQEEPKA